MGCEQNLLAELKRQRLVQKASEIATEQALWPVGLPDLDRLCGGGLPRGRISELILGASGGAGLLCALLAAAGRREELAALVDPVDGFDAASAQALGVDLARLLWVRPPGNREALRAAEILLEVGGLGLVVLQLKGHPDPRPSPAAWSRLRRAARGAVVAVLTEAPLVGGVAALVVEVERSRARWRTLPATCGSFIEAIDLGFAVRKKR